MNKRIFAILALFGLFLLSNPPLAVSKEKGADADIPEAEGTYNVPGRPDMKVRVFVHKAKPDPNPAAALVCDLSDPDSDAFVSGAGWKLPATWSYNLNVSSVPSSVGAANLPVIADNSFDAWTNAIPGKVTVTRGPNTSVARKALDGKNIIAWGRTSGTALGVTYIWYYTTTGLVAEVDTIMNKKFSWSWADQSVNPTCAYNNTYDAQNILVHEIGHWFGLDDEYDAVYANNTMYGYGSKTEVKKDTLTTGDKNGVSALY